MVIPTDLDSSHREDWRALLRRQQRGAAPAAINDINNVAAGTIATKRYTSQRPRFCRVRVVSRRMLADCCRPRPGLPQFQVSVGEGSMKSIAAGIILAVLLFAGGHSSFQESRHSKRLAEAHQRLCHPAVRTKPTHGERRHVLRPPAATARHQAGTESRHTATVSYWLARYTSLTESTNAAKGPQPNDSTLLPSRPTLPSGRCAVVEGYEGVIARLDQVVPGLRDVLRKDPTLTDAAFNYEYVVKLRDTIAKGPSKNAKAAVVKAPSAPDVGVDLPTGPMIHGRPGGPPEANR